MGIGQYYDSPEEKRMAILESQLAESKHRDRELSERIKLLEELVGEMNDAARNLLHTLDDEFMGTDYYEQGAKIGEYATSLEGSLPVDEDGNPISAMNKKKVNKHESLSTSNNSQEK